MLTAKDAWLATLGQLELQLNRATFDTWLRGAELIACEGDEFVVRVPHAYAKDWLDRHLAQEIARTLSAIYQQTVHLRFVPHAPSRNGSSAHPAPLFDGLPAEQPTDEPPLNSPTPAAPPAARPDYAEWDPRVSDVRRSADAASSDLPSHGLTRFDRRYTLESFVSAPCSLFAAAAARAVAENPGGGYNPLYLYGPPGAGKTHLLHAIAQVCQGAGRRVLYVTGEAFTNELIAAIRDRQTEELRARYRNVEVLLLDDVQFLAGKPSSEEEFLHTFNTLFGQGAQIVIAGSAHPRQLEKLDERLRSRFEGGLLADIQAPDLAARLDILKKKAAAQGTPLPDDVAETLARHETQSVRELEGLLTQTLARAALTQQPLSAALAEQVIEKNSLQPPRRRATNVEQVLQATAQYHQLSLDELLSPRRTKAVVRARQIAMYLAREETDASLPQIGEALGGRNHSTVLHGVQKIAQTVAEDEALRREIGDIRRQLYHSIN